MSDNRPFWRRKANKVVTYDVTGHQNDLYMTNKRGSIQFAHSGRKFSRGENIDPRFQCLDSPSGKMRVEEGFIFKNGESSARKVNLLRRIDTESDYSGQSEQEFIPLQQSKVFNNQRLSTIHAFTGQVKRQSPLKKEVAEKFIHLMEDMGNYEFKADDIKTQEEMIDKLGFVKSGISQLKSNIRQYEKQNAT
jgi:hypothetical protein